ncbi:RraA family protein [Niveispirillum sp. KHB5.9]|uniref:RraA family protein n=1 Tax=Niveispirillum sp. KHB5.9 TaxID=3400269 RepID=UPI003A87318F
MDKLLRERAARQSTATVHEAAGKIGALPAALKPLCPNLRLSGPAFPVKSPPGDNLWLHRAIYRASPGDVLVVDAGDAEYGCWGEVMALAAQVRGIAGLVIASGVRDSRRMVEMGFPVFASQIAIRGTGKDPDGAGTLNQPITLGETTINPGDWVLGDADGVVVIPASRAADIVEKAEGRDAAEQAIFARLRAGDSTIAIYNLPGGETWER